MQFLAGVTNDQATPAQRRQARTHLLDLIRGQVTALLRHATNQSPLQDATNHAAIRQLEGITPANNHVVQAFDETFARLVETTINHPGNHTLLLTAALLALNSVIAAIIAAITVRTMRRAGHPIPHHQEPPTSRPRMDRGSDPETPPNP
jgi:hypothetical protein